MGRSKIDYCKVAALLLNCYFGVALLQVDTILTVVLRKHQKRMTSAGKAIVATSHEYPPS
jgi:hypothetical protein